MKRTQKSAIKNSQSAIQPKVLNKSPEKLQSKDSQGKVWNFQKKKHSIDTVIK